MPTSQTGVRVNRISQGFTTIEILTALAIMAILCLLIIPSIDPLLGGNSLRSAARLIVNACGAAAEQAISEDMVCLVEGSGTTHRVRVTSGNEVIAELSLPGDVTFTDFSIIFNGDGSAEGEDITLSLRGGRKMRVEILEAEGRAVAEGGGT